MYDLLTKKVCESIESELSGKEICLLLFDQNNQVVKIYEQ